MADSSPSRPSRGRADMLTGNAAVAIALFGFPVMLGNLAQQLYNTSDAVIVGRVLGPHALAAISVASPVAFLVIFFFFGISVGISLLLALTYGSGDMALLRRQESTTLIAGVVFTLCFSALCIVAAEPVLEMIRTPPELIPDAKRYLNMVFLGLVAYFLNQYCAAVLRAIGNSRVPFLFLLLTATLHISLGVLLVGFMGFGLEGTALASLLAQGISALGCGFYIYRREPLLALKPSELTFHRSLLRQAISYSWATAFQQIVIYLGRFLVQGMVNPFGASVITGYNAATRVEGFVISPFGGFSTATATYTAQNLGARQYRRIHQGFSVSLVLILSYGILASAVVFFQAPAIMGLFLGEGSTEAITAPGVVYLRHMAFFYFLGGTGEAIQGFFRGMGRTDLALWGSSAQILTRLVISWFLIPAMGVPGICWATMAGWLVIATGGGLYGRRMLQRLDHTAEPVTA